MVYAHVGDALSTRRAEILVTIRVRFGTLHSEGLSRKWFAFLSCSYFACKIAARDLK